MSLSAAGFANFGTSLISALAAGLPAVITVGATDYDCAIDPSELSQGLEEFGMKPQHNITVIVANSEGLTITLGRDVTVKTTQTDALEGVVFTCSGITAHPNLPAKVLTLTRRP